MTFVAWFEVVVGVMIVALWITLLVTPQVPELAEGRRDIGWHLAAEVITAALLVAGGIASLCQAVTRRSRRSPSVRWRDTAVNSAGYTPTAVSGRSS